MRGAIQRNKPAAMLASARPAVRWGGVAIVAGTLIAVFVSPKTQPKAQPLAADAAPVLAADAALSEAMRAGDKAAARRLLALQFSLVDADGRIHPRREFLADLKRMAPASASGVKVRNFGLVVAVTGRHRSLRDSLHDAEVFFIDVWVRQKGAWRALLMQEVPIDDTPAATAASASAAQPQPYECDNPCKTIPYRVRSVAEQDVIRTFQTIKKAIVADDADEWTKHVADEFVAYASGEPPIAKSGQIIAIERLKDGNATVRVGEVQRMRLAVYGDGAVMTATGVDGGRSPYRTSRVFMKRDGQWLLAISAHTDVK
jgi:Domain of unknown function (DUF4440)